MAVSVTGRRTLVLPSIALAAILNTLNNDWIYSSLFYYTHPAWQVAATLLIPAIVVLAVAAALTVLLRAEWVVELLDILTLVIVAFFLYTIGRRNGHLEGDVPLLAKAALALAVTGLAYAASHYLSREAMSRLRIAVVVGCVLFLLAPEVLFPIEHTHELPLVSFFHEHDAAKRRPNTLILVLDELSDLKSSPVEAALRDGRRTVFARAVVSSGSDTVSAIPALLSGVELEDDRPCTPTALCDDVGLFDFARQTVERPRVNLVGFFHPYCEMRGLTYCRQIPVFGSDSIIYGYGCNLLQRLAVAGIKHKPVGCERQWLNAGRAQAARASIAAAVAAAPFWRDGGVLYVHILLPHPPGNRDGGTLEEDYAANLKLAGAFASELAGRLERSFGDDFLMVVTADHPLRLPVWCGMHRYARPGCAEHSTFASTHVPLITIGRGAEKLMSVEGNLKLFDALDAL